MLQSFRAPPQSTAAEFQRPRITDTQKMSTAAASAPNAPRQRSQYSLYDDIRCTGDGEPPQCDLPMEVVCNIFDYANFTCAMCEKKLCPWTIKEGWKHTYLCSRACFKETCIFQ